MPEGYPLRKHKHIVIQITNSLYGLSMYRPTYNKNSTGAQIN